MFDRSGVPRGDYTLRVVARDPSRPNEMRAIARNRLWLHGDAIFCIVGLINRGLVVKGNNVTIEFKSTGIVQSHLCNLDRSQYFECKYCLITCLARSPFAPTSNMTYPHSTALFSNHLLFLLLFCFVLLCFFLIVSCMN